MNFIYIFIYRFYLFIFRERGGEGEREGEKHQCVVASCAPPTGELACNPGMCPDGELNQRPFDLQAGTQSTEPQQLGPELNFKTTVSSTVRGPQFLVTLENNLNVRVMFFYELRITIQA